MKEVYLVQKLLRLVADDKFAQIKAMTTRPNLFRIVGRTHTETWHSMFLGWLLDPKGSHGLGAFPLRRFLVAIADPTIMGADSKLDKIAYIASIGVLESAHVKPNENEQVEFTCEVGRLDVFIENIQSNDGTEVIIIIEQKVGAPINKNQCQTYADWLWRNYPSHLKIPVLLAPEDRLGGTSEDTVGDSRWYGINYQALHDIVLVPIRSHPALRSDTAPLIDQYIDALRTPISGRKLAVTDDEKELAIALYEKHRDAFEAIQAALADTTDIDLALPPTKSILHLKVDGNEITGSSVSKFYKAVLKHVISNSLMNDDIIPYATSEKRYLVSKKPIHPGDKEFRIPVEFKGYFMESHKSRVQGLKDVSRFLKRLGCDVTIPVAQQDASAES